MFGCGCFYWNGISSDLLPPNRFSLPAPIAHWPQGQGFGSGRINLGELEVLEITNFDVVWRYDLYQDKKKGVAFYRPVEIPDGFHVLGHYCQSDDQPLRGYLLVARELSSFEQETDLNCNHDRSPALQTPLDYILEWSSNDESEDNFEGCGYFWLPQPPEGYKAMGYLVTTKPNKPELHDVQCVRADLTDTCETHHLILNASNRFAESTFQVWNTRPCHRGMLGKGIPVGTFFCNSYGNFGEELSVACLRNINPTLHAMPNLDQIHALISHYGPTIYFHPDDIYLPSSVSWFFENGALLYRAGDSIGEAVDASGSNLPVGGTNDGKYWIDLPTGERREKVKCGNLESARLYVHVKPALGGTYTDIAMWVFCPFNGPATVKVGIMNIGLSKVGQHVGDWEHFTLRISNFTGELWRIYFSQHSSGEWIDAFYLEFIEGNKAIVYSSKCGHASFPHPGNYIQGSEKLGIGVRNDAARSNLFVDSSTQYEIIAAEYLGDGAITEPNWLQFMREWGPTVVYDSKTELDKIINRLPVMLRHPVENIFEKLPVELYGEEGPSGPKEKNNWVGDERG